MYQKRYAKRRRRFRPKPGTYIFLALALAVVILVVFFIVKGIAALFGGPAATTPPPILPTIATPNVTAEPTPEPTQMVNIKMAGDMAVQQGLLDAYYDDVEDAYYFNRLFSKLDGALESDFTIASMETVFVDPNTKRYSGSNIYNSPKNFLASVKKTGVTALSLANSHILDQGITGVEQTIEAVEEANFLHFGAYTSQADHDNITLIDVNGVKIAVLAYTKETRSREDNLSAEQKQYAVNYTKSETIKGDISRAKEKGAELIILYMHWGELYTREATDDMKSLAEDLLISGADIIVGSHP